MPYLFQFDYNVPIKASEKGTEISIWTQSSVNWHGSLSGWGFET